MMWVGWGVWPTNGPRSSKPDWCVPSPEQTDWTHTLMSFVSVSNQMLKLVFGKKGSALKGSLLYRISSCTTRDPPLSWVVLGAPLHFTIIFLLSCRGHLHASYQRWQKPGSICRLHDLQVCSLSTTSHQHRLSSPFLPGVLFALFPQLHFPWLSCVCVQHGRHKGCV